MEGKDGERKRRGGRERMEGREKWGRVKHCLEQFPSRFVPATLSFFIRSFISALFTFCKTV